MGDRVGGGGEGAFSDNSSVIFSPSKTTWWWQQIETNLEPRHWGGDGAERSPWNDATPSFATTLVAVHSPFFFFFSKRKRIPAEYENLCARVPGGKEPVLFMVDVCPDVLEIPGEFWVVGGLRVDGGGNTKLYSIGRTWFW